jgi:hypothetical protein
MQCAASLALSYMDIIDCARLSTTSGELRACLNGLVANSFVTRRLGSTLFRAALEANAHLLYIDVSHAYHLTDSAFQEIGRICRLVTTVKAAHCFRLVDVSLPGASSLECVDFTGCSSIDHTTVLRLLDANRALRRVSLGNCYNICNACVRSIANLPLIRQIHLGNCPNVRALTTLALESLQSLDLTGSDVLDDISFEVLLRSCRALDRFWARCCGLLTTRSVRHLIAATTPSSLMDLRDCVELLHLANVRREGLVILLGHS